LSTRIIGGAGTVSGKESESAELTVTMGYGGGGVGCGGIIIWLEEARDGSEIRMLKCHNLTVMRESLQGKVLDRAQG